jgi:uncharacterized protein YceH (UPF0502 family)
MDLSQVLAPLIVGAIASVVTTLVAAFVTRAKTDAEVSTLNVASKVSVSADNREWAELFVARANAAELRADAAEKRADEAEQRAAHAEQRVGELEQKVNRLEAQIESLDT